MDDDYAQSLRELVYTGVLTHAGYDTLLGRYYGYKECCIKNYVNLLALDLSPAGFMDTVLEQHHDVGHVLCPMCYDEYDIRNPTRHKKPSNFGNHPNVLAHQRQYRQMKAELQ